MLSFINFLRYATPSFGFVLLIVNIIGIIIFFLPTKSRQDDGDDRKKMSEDKMPIETDRFVYDRGKGDKTSLTEIKNDKKPEIKNDEKPQSDDEKPQSDDEKPQSDDEKPQYDVKKPQYDDKKSQYDDEKPQFIKSPPKKYDLNEKQNSDVSDETYYSDIRYAEIDRKGWFGFDREIVYIKHKEESMDYYKFDYELAKPEIKKPPTSVFGPQKTDSFISRFNITMNELDQKIKDKLEKISNYEELQLIKRKSLLPKVSIMIPDENEQLELEDVIKAIQSNSIISLKEKTPEKEESPIKSWTHSPKLTPEKEPSPKLTEIETPNEKLESPEKPKYVESPEKPVELLFMRHSSTSLNSKRNAFRLQKKGKSSGMSVNSFGIGPDFEANALSKIIRHELTHIMRAKEKEEEEKAHKNDKIIQNNEIVLNFHDELLKIQNRIENKLNTIISGPQHDYIKSLHHNFPLLKRKSIEENNKINKLKSFLIWKLNKKIHNILKKKYKINKEESFKINKCKPSRMLKLKIIKKDLEHIYKEINQNLESLNAFLTKNKSKHENLSNKEFKNKINNKNIKTQKIDKKKRQLYNLLSNFLHNMPLLKKLVEEILTQNFDKKMTKSLKIKNKNNSLRLIKLFKKSKKIKKIKRQFKTNDEKLINNSIKDLSTNETSMTKILDLLHSPSESVKTLFVEHNQVNFPSIRSFTSMKNQFCLPLMLDCKKNDILNKSNCFEYSKDDPGCSNVFDGYMHKAIHWKNGFDIVLKYSEVQIIDKQ